MYKLYGILFSQGVRRVLSLMEEASLEYELLPVDLKGGAQFQPDFLALNPNHQVPVLDDEGFIIYESNAILRYLCTKHSLEHWYPAQVQNRALCDQWLDWCQCVLNPTVMNIVFHGVFAGEKGDKHLVALGNKKLPDCWNIIEQHLKQNTFFAGDSMTIADLAMYSSIFQLRFARVKPETPQILAWLAKMEAVPGVLKSLPPRN